LYTKKLQHRGFERAKSLVNSRGRTLALGADRNQVAMLLADRFLHREDGWFDIATAERVSVIVRPAGPRHAQIEWAERCAMLAVLRHPLLLPLIDYGAASSTEIFEAFALQPPLVGTGASLSHVVRHASRFLEAHGVLLSSTDAAIVFRTLVRSSTPVRGRPVGVSLQPRAACDAIAERLHAPGARGSVPIRISAPPRMGLRTLRMMVARLARTEGYLPVCSEALGRWREVASAMAGRHVCLLAQQEAGPALREAMAAHFARVSMGCGPPCVCLITERTSALQPGAIHLDPLGMKAMASMIYLDPEYGPSEQEVFDAARASEGAPGRFLDRLGGSLLESRGLQALLVHESPAEYLRSGEPTAEPRSPERKGFVTGPDVPEAKRSRIGSVLWRASSRAAALEARGRHLAAARLLTRAAGVLQSRRESSSSADCWLQLAWMCRTRGALERAQEHARQAATVDAAAHGQIRAGCLRAVCWTDAERFAEADGSLRDLLTAASALRDPGLGNACRLALARQLLWRGALDEAESTVERMADDPEGETAAQALILIARARLAAAHPSSALRATRLALARLPATAPGRMVASSHRVMAEALSEAGDLAQARVHIDKGLEAAAAARLPLQALRLRAIMVRALRTCRGDQTEADRLARRLERACRRSLPPLVEHFVRRQLAVQAPVFSGSRSLHRAKPAPFENFLDTAHRAASDIEAINGVLNVVCEHVSASAAVVIAQDRRICAAAGKPWRDRSRADEALVSGQQILFDVERQPPEAAEPIRCAGDFIGVIACRWIAGTIADPREVSDSLRAAGLSVAAHLRALLEEPPAPPPSVWGDLLGDSALASSLRDDIQRAARAPFPVLIEGESGSGKELVARAVHRLSPRHARRFCAINCAALSEELLEAELFGHTRGAFTGAMTERAGLFEEADGGTLFLDEVGELSGRAQAKLLRVLQEGEVRRVGENLPRRVDVRIVAATNRPLDREASNGRFRTDLRFRLDVLRITVPPLRERVGDVALLAQHFWKHATERVGTHATLGPDALAALSRYDWPGNVRELQNAIAWMAVHAPRRGRVGASVLPAQLAAAPLATGSSFELAREEFERRYVKAALAQAGGQRLAAARALGVSRQGLAKMLRRLRIEHE
jgi:DNA-binding NtrC family response regulator/tetratricopeptide (TPR) repeat protein